MAFRQKAPFTVFTESSHGVDYKYQIIKKVKHIVFESKKDFETYFLAESQVVPELKPWRQGNEGDWVEADDGGIVEIVKKGPLNHPNNSKNYKYHNHYVRTTVGTFIVSLRDPNKFKIDTDFKKHPYRYTFSGKGYNTIDDQIRNRVRTSKNERIFAYNVAHGMDVVEAYNKCYYNKPGIKQTVIKSRALLLMSQERIKKKVAEEVKDIAKELGIDHEYILGSIKTIADDADVDPKTALEALKTLGKAIGTTEPETNKLRGGVVGYIQSFAQNKLEEPDEVQALNQPVDVTEEKIDG